MSPISRFRQRIRKPIHGKYVAVVLANSVLRMCIVGHRYGFCLLRPIYTTTPWGWKLCACRRKYTKFFHCILLTLFTAYCILFCILRFSKDFGEPKHLSFSIVMAILLIQSLCSLYIIYFTPQDSVNFFNSSNTYMYQFGNSLGPNTNTEKRKKQLEEIMTAYSSNCILLLHLMPFVVASLILSDFYAVAFVTRICESVFRYELLAKALAIVLLTHIMSTACFQTFFSTGVCVQCLGYIFIIIEEICLTKNIPSAQQMRFYRQLQILGCVGNYIFHTWIAISYTSAVLFTIALTYNLFRHHGQFSFFVLIYLYVCDIGMLLISFIVFSGLIGIRKYSVRYYTDTRIRSEDFVSEYDIAFYKSCRPIEFNVGGIFTVASRDFCLRTYGTIILETTINLLLTFK